MKSTGKRALDKKTHIFVKNHKHDTGSLFIQKNGNKQKKIHKTPQFWKGVSL
jgi:hypothetical protein